MHIQICQEMRSVGWVAVCLCVGLTVCQQAVEQPGNGTSGDGSGQGARTDPMSPEFMSSVFAKISESLSGVFQGMPGMPSSNDSSSGAAGMFGNFGNMFGMGPRSNSTQAGNDTGGGLLPGGGMPSPFEQMQDMFSMISPMFRGQDSNGTSEGQSTLMSPEVLSPGVGTPYQGASRNPYGGVARGGGIGTPYYGRRRQMVVLPYLLRPLKVVPGNAGGLVPIEQQQENGSVAMGRDNSSMTNKSQGTSDNSTGSQPPSNNPLSGFPSMFDANGRPIRLDGMMVAMPIVMGSSLGAGRVPPGGTGIPPEGAEVPPGIAGSPTNGSLGAVSGSPGLVGEAPNVLPPHVATSIETYLSNMVQGYIGSMRGPLSRAPPQEEIKPKPLFCREFDCPPFEVLERGENYELRRYSFLTYAAADISKRPYAKILTFWAVADYILQGRNTENLRMPFTVPVLTRKTSPTNRTIMFLLPYLRQKQPPLPTSSQIRIVRMPAMEVYVRPVFGYLSDKQFEKEFDALKAELGPNATYLSNVTITAGYDTMFKFRQRYNEVWLVSKFLAEEKVWIKAMARERDSFGIPSAQRMPPDHASSGPIIPDISQMPPELAEAYQKYGDKVFGYYRGGPLGRRRPKSANSTASNASGSAHSSSTAQPDKGGNSPNEPRPRGGASTSTPSHPAGSGNSNTPPPWMVGNFDVPPPWLRSNYSSPPPWVKRKYVSPPSWLRGNFSTPPPWIKTNYTAPPAWLTGNGGTVPKTDASPDGTNSGSQASLGDGRPDHQPNAVDNNTNRSPDSNTRLNQQNNIPSTYRFKIRPGINIF